MEKYTHEEYGEILHFFYISGRIARNTARMYREHWLNRRHPHWRTFDEVYRRFRETGVPYPMPEGRGMQRNRRLIQIEEEIEQLFEQDPTISVRQVARRLGVSKSLVFRVIKATGKYPYRYK